MARIKWARDKARLLYEEYGASTVPVDLDCVARALGARIEPSHLLSAGVSGVLVPAGTGQWIIGVNAAHPITRQRFSIAHEIGHIVLHGFESAHADASFIVRMRDERSADGSVDEEIEANQFAAELLMPRGAIREALRGARIEHDARETDSYSEAVGDLARRFKVSRQALTLRLAALGIL